MKEILEKFFKDAASYQSIDPSMFNLEEYTEEWIEKNEKVLNIDFVSQQRELLKAFYKYCFGFYLNAKHLADKRIDGFFKSLL